jgi:arabinose-5-phosphate isomerase
MNMLEIAKEVFKVESNEVLGLTKLLTEDFEKAVKSILDCNGKVIIVGMGKSGIVGKKIAATMASTGTPSFFMHPGEAYHGDLGMIQSEDVVILISNSGETDEVLKIIPFLKHQKNVTISMSGNPESTLANNTEFHLNISVSKEACPLQLAPTSSTTTTMVMGDAIAVALMTERGFNNENFAIFHPGGALGRRLLTKVKDIMHSSYIPTCSPNDSISIIIKEISKGKCGLTVVMDKNSILGVITDGDIRRVMETQQDIFFSLFAEDLMSTNPKSIRDNEALTNAQSLMSENNINTLLVTDKDGLLCGTVQMYDLGI